MSNFCRFRRSPIGSDTVCPTCDPDCRRSSELPQSTSQLDTVMTRRAELLAIKTGKLLNKPAVLLAFRVGTLSLRPVNLALTAQQAHRLLTDLTQLFSEPDLLVAAGEPDGEAKLAYDRIMGGPDSTADRPEEKQ